MDCQREMQALLEKLVKQRQQISVHTVEEGKNPKTFGSLLKHGKGAFGGPDADDVK
jgi:hypothetical protein